MRTKRLMVNFESDEAKEEADIDRCTNEITDVFRYAERILKQFGSMEDEKSSAELVRKNGVRAAVTKLQGLSITFRTSQKEYLTRLGQKSSGDTSRRFDFLDAEASSGGGAAVVDYGFNRAQMQVVENTEQLVNSRDSEIRKIAKSVEELATIFKDLRSLVIEQGTMLDRIDYNMEMAVEKTKEGVKEVKIADEYQKQEKSRANKCMFFLILSIAIVLAIFIVKHMPTKKK